MNDSRMEGVLAVAAIDFGTTYTGCAFSFIADPSKIFMPLESSHGIIEGCKTKTALCVSVKNSVPKLVSFGAEAYSDYGDYLLLEGEPKLYLFEQFKMELFTNKDLKESTTIRDKSGELEITAIDIFALALEEMKRKVTGDANKGKTNPLTTDDLLWVITVPAIWSNAAKEFMRKAAYKAELVKKTNPGRLVMALEPEAASIFCRMESQKESSKTSTSQFSDGTKYVVVDAGGGTVDITYHKVIEENKGGNKNTSIKELHYPTGGDWGGTCVDAKFVQMLSDNLGRDFIDKFQTANFVNWIEIMDKFETAKRGKADNINVHMPRDLYTAYGEYCRKDLSKLRNKALKLTNGVLDLQKSQVDALFKDTVHKIVDHLSQMLRSPMLQGISHIMLVGGFGESGYLQAQLRSHFGKHKTLMIPHDTSFAVVRGAVMFGYNPEIIQSRMARQTYGIAVNEDNKELLETLPNAPPSTLPLVKNVFCPFVHMNEEVKVGQVYMKSMHISSSKAHTVIIKLFATKRTNVKSVTAEDVFHMGEISFQIPENCDLGVPVNVKLMFGGTEVVVHVEGTGSNRRVSKRDIIRFLHG